MTHGSSAVHELIERSDLSYPISVSRLEREYPLVNIQIDERGTMTTVAELLSDVEYSEFESREDLEAKLGPVMRAESESRRTGIIGKLKQTFLGQ